MEECSTILGENRGIRVLNLARIAVEAMEGYLVCMMKEIRDQISLLQEEAKKALVKPLKVGNSCLLVSTDAHAQQLVHFESGREA